MDVACLFRVILSLRFILLMFETGLFVASVCFFVFLFDRFLRSLLNIFPLCCSLLCLLLSVSVLCSERKGEGGAVNSFVILINYHISLR